MSALHWTVVIGRFAPPGDFVDQVGFIFKKSESLRMKQDRRSAGRVARLLPTPATSGQSLCPSKRTISGLRAHNCFGPTGTCPVVLSGMVRPSTGRDEIENG
jgi:hypothetical protein